MGIMVSRIPLGIYKFARLDEDSKSNAVFDLAIVLIVFVYFTVCWGVALSKTGDDRYKHFAILWFGSHLVTVWRPATDFLESSKKWHCKVEWITMFLLYMWTIHIGQVPVWENLKSMCCCCCKKTQPKQIIVVVPDNVPKDPRSESVPELVIESL